MFTKDGYPVQSLDKPVLVKPMLEGTLMQDFEVERRFNRVGEIDFLKFYLPPVAKTMYLETNLILELPNGVAFEYEEIDSINAGTFCTRELDSGELVELECDSMALESSDSYLRSLRSVRLRSICN